MIKVGLTGNIGSGKTTIAHLFEIMGIPIYNADLRGRVISQHSDVINEVVAVFGSTVITSEGLIDRKILADIVFKDAEKLKQLNGIIHPRVRVDFIDWCNAQIVTPYVIHESAILFESGLNTMFEKTILVTAPDVLKLERVIRRDGVSKKDIINRIANQWPDSQKAILSDFIIVNDEETSLIEQVFAIHHMILANYLL